MDKNKLEQEIEELQSALSGLKEHKAVLEDKLYRKQRELHKKIITGFLPDDAMDNIRCVWVNGLGKVTKSELKIRDVAIQDLEKWLDFHAGHTFEFVGRSIVMPRLDIQREYGSKQSMTVILEVDNAS